MRRFLHSCILAALLALTLIAPPQSGRAQTDGSSAGIEVDRQRRQSVQERTRLDAAAEAALFSRFDESRRVSYAEVLERPDDPELNFRWAQTQVADGNSTGAAATLQRILLVQPDLPLVRMFYAVVLLRLGSLAAADEQLALLEEQRRAVSLRAQIRRYRQQIRRAQRRTRHAVTLMAGSLYDSNRNSGPDSNQVLLADTRVGLGTSLKKTADSGWFSLTEWRTEHDLGFQEDRQLVAGAAYIHSQQQDLESLDVQALRLDLGLRTRETGQLVYPRLVVDVVDLSRETYLRAVGLEIEARRPLSARLDLEATLSLLHDDFDGIPEAPTASERSGYRGRVEAVLGYTPHSRHRLDLSGALDRKGADRSYHAYWGWELSVAHTWLLERGPFLLSSLGVSRDVYLKNQDAVSSSRRRDFRTRGRMSLGIPLGVLLGDRLPTLHDAVLSLSTEIQLGASNLPNYEFNNRKLGVSLSKRFEL